MESAPEITIGFRMKVDEVFPFIRNAMSVNPKFSILESNGVDMHLRLQTTEVDNAEHQVEVDISKNEENCLLRFSLPKGEDSMRLPKLAQATIWAITQYGYKKQVFWGNDALMLDEATDEKVERVEKFLQEHPMSTVEEISDGTAMLQYMIAQCLSELGKHGKLDRTPVRYFLK